MTALGDSGRRLLGHPCRPQLFRLYDRRSTVSSIHSWQRSGGGPERRRDRRWWIGGAAAVATGSGLLVGVHVLWKYHDWKEWLLSRAELESTVGGEDSRSAKDYYLRTLRSNPVVNAVDGAGKSGGSDGGLRPPPRNDLPLYRIDEVKRHGREAQRIWVTYQQGVYDVTEFAGAHPGGDKILLAAGGAVDPYWAIYAQHKTSEVMEIMEELRIGSLHPDDVAAGATMGANIIPDAAMQHDPFGTDPPRHPALVVNSSRPFNAESPAALLTDTFHTPNELFFVRNHMPVPQCDERSHRLEVEGIGIRRPLSLSVEELKTGYEPCSVTAALQCAGNRRKDMDTFKKVQGLMWSGTAISNARWTGCRLRDVLLTAGVDPNDKHVTHVQFEGADADATGAHYGASIPVEKALSPEVLIAYEMNGEALPRDHGYPLRVIAPGIVGARQVKWLTRIRTSDEESHAHWQRRDYKVLPSSVNFGDALDQHWDATPAIQEYPVQSAICSPPPNSKVREGETAEVCGYAWSGGGRGIVRVEVSADGGKSWRMAKLEQDPDQPMTKMWAWTLWRAEVAVPKSVAPLAEGGNRLELVCRATDIAYNTQPETPSALWNVRGLLNTAWHRVPVRVSNRD